MYMYVYMSHLFAYFVLMYACGAHGISIWVVRLPKVHVDKTGGHALQHASLFVVQSCVSSPVLSCPAASCLSVFVFVLYENVH